MPNLNAFADIAAHKYMSLTSYRKGGDAVATPVWLVSKDEKLYVWTDTESWKAKRLRRDPRCTVAPCNASGKEILGPAVNGRARFLEGAEATTIADGVKARYGFQFHLIATINRLRGIKQYAIIEIAPA